MQYFITVDEKLEELTSMLLGDEKENLDIASTIDDIQGLIVDIYGYDLKEEIYLKYTSFLFFTFKDLY